MFNYFNLIKILLSLLHFSQLVEDRPYIDQERIAIWGWSYGGYTAVSVLATEEETFSCGISVAPITNWLYYG